MGWLDPLPKITHPVKLSQGTIVIVLDARAQRCCCFLATQPCCGRSSSMSLSPVPARGCTIRACKLEGPGEGTDSLTINNLTVTHRMSGPGYSKSGPWSSGICVTWELVLSLKSYQDVLYQNLHWNKIPRRFECTVSLYFSHLFPR